MVRVHSGLPFLRYCNFPGNDPARDSRLKVHIAVIRKNLIRTLVTGKIRSHFHVGLVPPLEIVVHQEVAVTIGFQPVVQVNLVEIGSHQFFSQLMGFATQERHLQPGQHGNQRLGNSIRIHPGMRVRRLYLTQRAFGFIRSSTSTKTVCCSQAN
jgi:hypothetical protein